VSAEGSARSSGRTGSALRFRRPGVGQSSGHGANHIGIIFLAKAVAGGRAGDALNFIIVRDRLLRADHHDVAVQGLNSARAA
jgi:hypothetical protein